MTWHNIELDDPQPDRLEPDMFGVESPWGRIGLGPDRPDTQITD